MSEPRPGTGLDSPQSGAFAFRVVVAVCALLVLLDAMISTYGHFAFEDAFPGFEGLFGFVACVLLVLAAKQMRRVLKRDEDYYDA